MRNVPTKQDVSFGVALGYISYFIMFTRVVEDVSRSTMRFNDVFVLQVYQWMILYCSLDFVVIFSSYVGFYGMVKRRYFVFKIILRERRAFRYFIVTLLYMTCVESVMDTIVIMFLATNFRNFGPSNDFFCVPHFRVANDRRVNRIVPFFVARRIRLNKIRRYRYFIVFFFVRVTNDGWDVGAINVEDVKVLLRVVTRRNSAILVFRFVYQACRRVFYFFTW